MGAQLSTGAEPDASRTCTRHAQAVLPLRCAGCSAAAQAEPSDPLLCISCIHEHSLTFPSHALAPCAGSASTLRAALAELVSPSPSIASRCDKGAPSTAATTPKSTTAIGPRGRSSGVPTDAAQTVALASSLVEGARRRALALQAGLDALALNLETARGQLDANRDAALAYLEAGAVTGADAVEIRAAFASGVDAVLAAAAVKRSGLESELVAADAALGTAIEAASALAEVGCNCATWPTPRAVSPGTPPTASLAGHFGTRRRLTLGARPCPLPGIRGCPGDCGCYPRAAGHELLSGS